MPAQLNVEAGNAFPAVCELTDKRKFYLGRKRDSTIVLLDQHASRVHAEVFFDNNRWFVRDCGTLNGTRVNGQPIREAVPLEDGAQIGIGDIRLRFGLGTGAPAAKPPVPMPKDASELTQTTLQQDELAVLVDFMRNSLAETTPRGLLQLALSTIKCQTGADLCGCLSLDENEPFPREVFPATAAVDVPLSRRLTQQVLRDNCSIWLAACHDSTLDSDSLAEFTDAVCIPLRAWSRSGPAQAAPLGALHVYRAHKVFTERQVRFCELLAGYLANSLRLLRSRRALEADNTRLRVRSSTQSDLLIGDSPAMNRVRQQIGKLADRPRIVLITGESGVGKELVAMGLHQQSSRCDEPLVVVNCAAYAAGLLESELFGHNEGAFTGATCAHPGHFQLADDGTLFLDEVGELTLECQAKLLRVLETGTFWPVGGRAPVTVDVRILAATNRDLAHEVRAGKFREDLLYRLGIAIHVPPLRDHKEDIPALAASFLDKLSEEYRRSFHLSEAALDKLMHYAWPGNVRLLRIVLENAAAMTDDDEIESGFLQLAPLLPARERPTSLNLVDVERWAIREVIEQTGGNKSQAARILGIHRDTLIQKLKDMKLD